MRLYKHLNEKISKKEIDDVLSNDNIQCGAEFEFMINMDDYEELLVDDYQVRYYEDAIEAAMNYNNELDDYRDEVNDWKNKLEELEERLGEVEDEDEVTGIKEKIDNLEQEEPELPEFPEEVVYYAQEYMGVGRVFEVFDFGEEIDLSFIEDPYYQSPDEVEIIDHIEKIIDINNIPIIKKNGYIIGRYETKSTDKWVIKDDQSLGDNGIEFASPVFPMSEFVKMVPKFFKVIEKYGYTDSNCGLHINMSFKNVQNLFEKNGRGEANGFS